MPAMDALASFPRVGSCTAASPKESKGGPSVRGDASRAAISDSAVECNITVCCLHAALSRENALGPTGDTKTPIVVLELLTQSAKEAS
eukprot:8947224-Pyramimonas_sp.AAC.1